MRKMLLAVALLVVACGGDLEPPELSIDDAAWQDGQVTVEVATNLPDGAELSWYVLEGDDWDDLDAADVSGFVTVDGGEAVVAADVAGFSADMALVEVGFVPRYEGQPDSVREAYDADQGASDEASISRQ